MKVVGIDPSLTATGLASIDLVTHDVLAWECVVTKVDSKAMKTHDLARRLTEIAGAVTKFCALHGGVVTMEAMTPNSFGRASIRNVGMLMASYGTIIGALGGRKPILLMPAEVKRRLTGMQGASKGEAWTRAENKLTSYPSFPGTKAKDEAVKDAVCVALAARPELNQIQELVG